MKRCVLVVLLTVGLVSTADSQETAGSLRVGFSLPLSGVAAEYGAAVRNGIELAQKKDPAIAQQLSLVFEDNQYDSAHSVAAYRRLVDIEKVSVVYNWGETPLWAIAGEAERKAIPVLSMTIDPEPTLDKHNVVAALNPPEDFVALVLKDLRAKGSKSFGIIQAEDPYFNALLKAFRGLLRKGESLELIDTVSPDDVDFKSQIIRIKQKKPDALGVYLFPGQVGTFLRQMASVSKQPVHVFGSDVFESRVEIQNSGPLMEGATYGNLKTPSWFIQEYTTKYAQDSQITFAYHGYVIVKALAKLSPKLSSKEPLSMIRLLELLKEETEDVGFKVAFDKTKRAYFQFPVVLRQINAGSFKNSTAS